MEGGTGQGRCSLDEKGRLRVLDGDWIITGIKGEKYPCKPDIFEASYEEVESGVGGSSKETSKKIR